MNGYETDEQKNLVMELLGEMIEDRTESKKYSTEGISEIDKQVEIMEAAIESMPESERNVRNRDYAEIKKFLENAMNEKRLLELLSKQADIDFKHFTELRLSIKRNEIDLSETFGSGFECAELSEDEWADRFVEFVKPKRIPEIEPLIEMYENEDDPILDILITGEESRHENEQDT